MDEKTKIRCDIDLTFQEHLYEIGLFCLVGGGSGIEVLKRLVTSYFNSGVEFKIPRILICGAESSGKRTVSHAFINSLAIENVTYIESDFLDSSFGGKRIFKSGSDRALIIGHIEEMHQQTKAMLWQYLAYGKCYYHNFQNNDWEIVHYNGILILTSSNKKELISKELLKQIDVIIELEPYQEFQLRKILEQRICYMKLKYEVSVINLLLNSSENKIDKLMRLLKLGIISMMSQDRNELYKSDIDFALEHYK